MEEDGQVEDLGDNDDGVKEGCEVSAERAAIGQEFKGHSGLLDEFPGRGELKGLVWRRERSGRC